MLYFFFIFWVIFYFYYFFLSERNLAEIKKFYKSPDKISSMKKGIVIKYICYFSIGSAFLIFFWYYLSSFCAVFKNSQIYLIKNTFISLGISAVYPFLINILPSIIRFISLNKNKTNRRFIYETSKIIQIL